MSDGAKAASLVKLVGLSSRCGARLQRDDALAINIRFVEPNAQRTSSVLQIGQFVVEKDRATRFLPVSIVPDRLPVERAIPPA